ncbi:unnamed protein product [Phytophthora fragariaefolia]|uniref:Unnamed protein product n=1 Tax=Phytophthora fragariaefolia TaxID=1490495 RepID=A0A9W6TNY4_9STRA|nr:unnamed protein product [Phytophthora fragariaefolia]
MVKLTGSPNYKLVEIERLLVIVQEYLPLGKVEWERVATDYNLSRSRGWVERDVDSLRRKFKALYSMRKPTGTAEMSPHVKKAKLAKRSIDDKANVVEMDDEADEDEEGGNSQESDELFVEPDFSFDPYFDDGEGGDSAARNGTDTTSSTPFGGGDSLDSEAACDQAVNEVLVVRPPRLAETPDSCDVQVGADGLEAFAPTPRPAPLPSAPPTRQLRSAGLKKPRKSSAPNATSADVAAAVKTRKPPAARGFIPGSRDEQEAHRHASLQSASNRLGGGNLYAFRDSVGAKRAREGEDQEQAEASFARAKRIRALKTTTALKKKLSDLETTGSHMGSSTFEMMLLLREENERKSEARRVEEDQRRRDEAAAKEARIQADKVEAEERRRQDKLEAEERVRRDKEDARARTQEMIMLIGAIFKKE